LFYVLLADEGFSKSLSKDQGAFKNIQKASCRPFKSLQNAFKNLVKAS